MRGSHLPLRDSDSFAAPDNLMCVMVGRRLAVLVIATVVYAALAGCSASPERRYPLTGQVVAVDKQTAHVTIAHEAIPGYMAAMTMPYRVKDRWALDVLAPGSRVQATLVVAGNHSWLQDLVITKGSSNTAPTLASMSNPQPGDPVPQFALVNQDGRKFSLAQYHGRALALTFIYTRCPLPDYCPLMNSNFQKLDALLAREPALYQKTHLLTISFDPENDTPEVLRSFGAHYAGKTANDGFAHWDFATGKPGEIKRMALFFGFNYWPESGQIVHSLSTAVIRPDGRIQRIYRGNDWTPEQILSDLRGLL